MAWYLSGVEVTQCFPSEPLAAMWADFRLLSSHSAEAGTAMPFEGIRLALHWWLSQGDGIPSHLLRYYILLVNDNVQGFGPRYLNETMTTNECNKSNAMKNKTQVNSKAEVQTAIVLRRRVKIAIHWKEENKWSLVQELVVVETPVLRCVSCEGIPDDKSSYGLLNYLGHK